MRGSEDGYTANVFHEKCDDKGANLVVIKTTLDRIFGGFTKISW